MTLVVVSGIIIFLISVRFPVRIKEHGSQTTRVSLPLFSVQVKYQFVFFIASLTHDCYGGVHVPQRLVPTERGVETSNRGSEACEVPIHWVDSSAQLQRIAINHQSERPICDSNLGLNPRETTSVW